MGNTYTGIDDKTGAYRIFNDDNINEARESSILQGTVGGTTYNSDVLNFGRDTSTNWFGKNGYFDTGSQILGGLTSGLAAYTAYKNLGLAQDKFDFEKSATNRNAINEAGLANSLMDRNARIVTEMAGSNMTDADRAKYIANRNAEHLSTAPIG